MNCLDCKHCGPIFFNSSHHRECHVLTDAGDRMKMMAIIKFLGYVPYVVQQENGKEEAVIILNKHGVKNGWCDWPVQFDPIWIEKCLFFTEKQQLTNP